jgi:hypothetical protein
MREGTQHWLLGGRAAATLAGCAILAALAAGTACSTSPSLQSVQIAATRAAPTQQAASTAAAPTVAAVQTRASGTVQAAATAAAPAAQAAATQAAPTLRALSTNVAQPTLPTGIRTAVATSTLRIAGVGTNRADPTITVRNDGESPASLNGWSFLVGDESVRIPTTSTWTVPAKSTVTLHLSSGSTKGDQVYLGKTADTATIKLIQGKPVTLVDTKSQPASVYNLGVPTSTARP